MNHPEVPESGDSHRAKPEMVRAFIALPIPDAVKAEIERTQAQMQIGLPGKIARWTKREQLHLTLRFLGNVSADQITELADALRAVTSGFPALNLRAERIGCFPHPRFPRVLWVWVHDEAHQLPLLQQNIESAAGKFAESKADKEFTGHVTIARINGIERPEAEALARLASSGLTASATTYVTVVPAVPLGPFTVFKAEPSSITSGAQPLCVTLSWNVSPGTVSISAEPFPAGTGPVTSLASGLPGTGTYVVCPTETTVYTATASSSGDKSSATVTVAVDAPVIQTSCMQIIKKPKDQSPACINVCFEIGGEKRLVSVELDLTGTCNGPWTKIAVFGPNVPNPALRVSSLQCAPCGIDAGAVGKTPDCSGIDFVPGAVPPFDLNMGAFKETCEFVLDTIQPTGTTFDLGADPQFWNGAYYMNVAVCPRSAPVNCNGICKTTCP